MEEKTVWMIGMILMLMALKIMKDAILLLKLKVKRGMEETRLLMKFKFMEETKVLKKLLKQVLVGSNSNLTVQLTLKATRVLSKFLHRQTL